MSIGISGCTSCQLGGEDALKAYDRVFQARKESESIANDRALMEQKKTRDLNNEVNQPIAGAVIGGQININV